MWKNDIKVDDLPQWLIYLGRILRKYKLYVFLRTKANQFICSFYLVVALLLKAINHILSSSDENGFVPMFVCALGLPTMNLPLHIFEPRYKLLVRRTLESKSKMFGMCMYDADRR